MIVRADAARIPLPDGVVQLSVCSPPYHKLRKYEGIAEEGQLGLEETPEEFVAKLVSIFREVRRVLRDDGVCAVNLSVSYAGSRCGPQGKTGQRSDRWFTYERGTTAGGNGYQPGDLIDTPGMFARAMQRDGWVWRSTVIWAKGNGPTESAQESLFPEMHREPAIDEGLNPMPESVVGWFWSRHRLSYADVQRMWPGYCGDGIWTGDVCCLQTREVLSREEALSAESEGQGDGQGARGEAGREGEAAAVLSVAARQEESEEVRGDRQGQGDGTPSGAEVPASPAEQGWPARGRERGPSLSAVQLEEARQNPHRKTLDCPGCERCAPNDGLVLRKGSWRPTSSFEYVFIFAKSGGYFADGEAVRSALSTAASENYPARAHVTGRGEQGSSAARGNDRDKSGSFPPNGGGRNLRNVWYVPSQPTSLEHYASFPEKLVEPLIKAFTPEAGCCRECGAPVARVVERTAMEVSPSDGRQGAMDASPGASGRTRTSGTMTKPPTSSTLGHRPTCQCADDASSGTTSSRTTADSRPASDSC